MADPIGTFSGLASGIQWRDMVTQIVALESKRTVDPLTTRRASLTNASGAWLEFQTVVGKFRDAAKAMRDGTVFSAFSTSASKSPTTGRDLVSVSADSTASPASYSIEVQQLASAEKLGGAVVATATTALGVNGAFALNGKTVSLSATDTLTTLRDKVNALNSGATPSGVSASILRSGSGARLVLSSSQTGSAGVELTDDAGGALQLLGFTDATVTSNITAAGITQSNRFGSSITAFTSMLATSLGIPLPTPSKVKVGDQYISVDFAVDSLATIAARINAATGSNDAAEVITDTVGSTTYSRLQTSLSVAVDSRELVVGDTANSARTLAVLGFTKAGLGGVQQVVASTNTFTNALDQNAGGGTLLSDLKAGAQSLTLSVGDVITISGKRGDGSIVTRTVGITTGNETLQTLIDSANDATTGFGTAARSAVLSVSSGQLQLTDSTAGDSQLAMSITVAKAGAGTISLGGFSTDGGTVGRNRQISAGTDSRFRIDDQVVTRNSNAISDVVTGVTFNLLSAEVGTAVEVAIARNFDDAVSRMQSFASAYNDIRTWTDNNTGDGKRLAGNSALRSMANSISSTLLQTVAGLSGNYTLAAMAGVSRDKTGVLSVNASALTAALSSSFDDVKRLFSQSGVPSDAEVIFDGATDKTKATATPYAVVITQAPTTASIIGAAFANYTTAGTPDTLLITDASTGYTGSIALTNGDSLAKVIANLNGMFTTSKMNLVASSSGGAVKIASNDYGTAGGFTVAYTAGSADGTAQLGISAAPYIGLDVAGSIGGTAATGKGRLLTGPIGSDVEGMRLTYTGSTARAAGDIAYSVGVGGMLYNVAVGISRDLDGQAVVLATSSATQADAMSSRILDAQDRLARRQASLIAQFTAMESAMSRAQSVSASLTSAINGLFNYNKSA